MIAAKAVKDRDGSELGQYFAMNSKLWTMQVVLFVVIAAYVAALLLLTSQGVRLTRWGLPAVIGLAAVTAGALDPLDPFGASIDPARLPVKWWVLAALVLPVVTALLVTRLAARDPRATAATASGQGTLAACVAMAAGALLLTVLTSVTIVLFPHRVPSRRNRLRRARARPAPGTTSLSRWRCGRSTNTRSASARRAKPASCSCCWPRSLASSSAASPPLSPPRGSPTRSPPAPGPAAAMMGGVPPHQATHEVTVDAGRGLVIKRYRSWSRGEPAREWAALTLLAEFAPGLAPAPARAALQADPPEIVMSFVRGTVPGARVTPHDAEALGVALDRRRAADDDDVLGQGAVLGQGDGNLANFLWDGGQVRIVDFEDSGPGDRAFELAVLVEHLSAWPGARLDTGPFLARFCLTDPEKTRLTECRRLSALFWLLMLLPGGPASTQPARHTRPAGQPPAHPAGLMLLGWRPPG